MKRFHADRLREKFAEALNGKPIIMLRIPDKYPFQAPALVILLHQGLAAHLDISLLSSN